MKVAYILSSPNCQKLLTSMIIPQLQAGKHGAEVLGMFFVMDNTYFLLDGTETGEDLQELSGATGMLLMGCDQCVHERGLDGRLVPAAQIGCFPNLYAALAGSGLDQVITL
ncbi:MAG: sulfur reduction protein DsrE [Syntrophobacteraceae bacterium]|nr:sulfur reduction protein DsrE [Syntrophobacteraceae bacterium]